MSVLVKDHMVFEEDEFLTSKATESIHKPLWPGHLYEDCVSVNSPLLQLLVHLEPQLLPSLLCPNLCAHPRKGGGSLSF